jgi:hypothetical protein
MNPRRHYVSQLIDSYLWLPVTPLRASRRDRALAGALYDRGVPLQDVQAALMLAGTRLALRSPQAPSLPPVRTLHYFLPVLEEVRHLRPDPEYLDYLRAKLRPLAEAKENSRVDTGPETRVST